MRNKFIIGVYFLIIFGVACSQVKNNPLADKNVPAKGLANPAAIKCIKDGYALKPIEKNGVAPIGYFCVNKETGMKCEIWSYFRGECNLSY
jgi:putative hemolysin